MSSPAAPSAPLSPLQWFAALVLMGVVAVAAHIATLVVVPEILMNRVLNRLTLERQWNVMLQPERVDAAQRVVVMPSPDLLYSLCAYDLSKGPVRVQAEVPPATPWSLTVFDQWTDNFFSDDDRKGLLKNSASRDYLIATQAQSDSVEALWRDHPLIHLVYSPTPKGLVMMRTVINQESRLAELDETRRKGRCAPLSEWPIAEAP